MTTRPYSTPSRRTLALVLGLAVMTALLIICVLLSIGAVGGPAGTVLRGSGAASAGAAPALTPSGGRFTISGDVAGLYPGKALPLVLTVANPEPFTIVVTAVTTTVTSPTAQCPATLLTVTPFSGTQTVPAHGNGHLTVTASLAHSAPNGCQGVVFPFLYSGVAEKP